MGDNSDKKINIGHRFFHEESIYEISNKHGSELMLYTVKQQHKWPEIAKGHNSNISFNRLKF